MDVRIASICSFLLVCLASVKGYEDMTLAEYIDSQDFIFFKSIMNQDTMADVLSETGPFTVFAPVDAAFAMIAEDLDKYTPVQLQAILEYHVIEGYVLTSIIDAPTNYTSWLGETVAINPVNDTFILNGEAKVFVDSKDQIVNNGVIHRLDTVMLPPGNTLTSNTIIQVFLLDDANFQDLFLALMIAELVELLEDGDFTIFAPSNVAFGGNADDILDPEIDGAKEIYAQVLKYHIVPGGRRSSKLRDGQLYTLEGQALDILNTDSGITVNGFPIVKSDIFAANGIIHMIDEILLPTDIGDIPT